MHDYRPYAGYPANFGASEPGPVQTDQGATDTLLQQILDALQVLVTDAAERTPKGILYWTSETILLNDQNSVQLTVPLFDMVVVNDGPGILQIKAPSGSPQDWLSMNPGEVVVFAFPKAVIKGFQRRTISATTSYRIYGTY